MTQLNTLRTVERSPGGGQTRVMAPKPAEQIQQEMAVIIANGGRYFAWDSPTAESGLTPERFAFMGRVVAPFLRERQAWCLGTERVADVSLLHDAASHYAVNDAAETCFTRRNNRLEGAARHLARWHLNYELVPDWRLEAREINSPLLIVEHAKRLSDASSKALLGYARDGGTLLLTGMSPLRHTSLRQACGLGDVAGPGGGETLTVDIGDQQISLDHWLFRITTSDAKMLLSVRDAQNATYPLLLEKPHGNGRLLYFAAPMLTAHGDNLIPDPIIKYVLERARPAADRLVTTDAPETVEVVLRRRDNIHLLHLVNMAPGHRETLDAGRRRYTTITDIPAVPPCHVSIRLPSEPTSVTLHPGNQEITDATYENGKLRCELPGFPIHAVLVLEIAEK
jgi:hypothetical protein